MKLKNTLILLGIVIILFALVYVFEIRKPDGSTGKSKSLGKAMLLERENVQGIELAYSDADYEKIVCSKDKNGQWQIQEPVKAKANGKIIDRLISRAVGKNIHSTLKKPGSLTEYGLAAPRVTAVFHLSDGTSRTIMLGNTVPIGNYVYVKQKSAQDISLVPASIVDDLTAFVSDLRDRTFITLSNLDIQRIQLNYRDSDNIICVKTGSDWNILEPVSAKADNGEVEKLISNVKDLKADDFAAEAPDDLSIYGLSPPQIEIIFSLEDGRSKSLAFGKKERDSVYVKTGSDNSVIMVNAEIIAKLTKRPADLRDRTVMAFQMKAVEKLVLRYPGRSFTCEKKTDAQEESWEITVPIKAKADKSQIDEMLKKLQDLRVDEFVSDTPGELSGYGLTQPLIQAIVHTGGAESESLLVGRKMGESVYVKTASAASVYLVDAGIINDLSKKPLDLYHRQVMKFRKNEVVRIELRSKDREAITCIKQERDWRIVEPVRKKAKNYEINGILQKLYELKTRRFVTEKAARLSMYGLDHPDVEITLTYEDGSKETLHVGKSLPDSDLAYAKTAAKDIIFVIEKDVVDELRKDVDILDAG